jgi:hypothetical protein
MRKMMHVYKSRFKIATLIISLAGTLVVSCSTCPLAIAAEDAPESTTSPLSISATPGQPIPVDLPSPPNPTSQTSVLKFAEQFQPDISKEDMRKRPLLYFRNWANTPLPPVQSFFFLLFATLVVSELMPTRLERARRSCASSYWRSLWCGIVASLLFVASARALLVSEIGIPLGFLSLAALELFLLIGFAISATLIGQTLLTTMRLDQTPGSSRVWVGRLGAPFLGTLLLSFVLMIPQIGLLPRIGIRLIMLLCFLGMGAWFRTGMGTKEMGSTSEK